MVLTPRVLRTVRLRGRIRVLDLRRERLLDALRLDGEISTSRSTRVLRTCWELSSRAHRWYGDDLHGIVHTSRTTARTSVNLASFDAVPLRADSVGRLRNRRQPPGRLTVDDGCRVDLPDWV